MKTKIFTLLTALLCLFLSSCSTQRYSLSKSYNAEEYYRNQTETQLPVKEIWSTIINYCTDSGVPLKIIDRASGLILTEKTTFEGLDTHEDKNGNLIDETAYVVSAVPAKNLTNTNAFGDRIDPYEITGSWSIRIKTVGDITTIEINPSDLKCKYRKPILGGMYASSTFVDVPVYSTGVFEKKILDLFE